MECNAYHPLWAMNCCVPFMYEKCDQELCQLNHENWLKLIKKSNKHPEMRIDEYTLKPFEGKKQKNYAKSSNQPQIYSKQQLKDYKISKNISNKIKQSVKATNFPNPHTSESCYEEELKSYEQVDQLQSLTQYQEILENQKYISGQVQPNCQDFEAFNNLKHLSHLIIDEQKPFSIWFREMQILENERQASNDHSKKSKMFQKIENYDDINISNIAQRKVTYESEKQISDSNKAKRYLKPSPEGARHQNLCKKQENCRKSKCYFYHPLWSQNCCVPFMNDECQDEKFKKQRTKKQDDQIKNQINIELDIEQQQEENEKIENKFLEESKEIICHDNLQESTSATHPDLPKKQRNSALSPEIQELLDTYNEFLKKQKYFGGKDKPTNSDFQAFYKLKVHQNLIIDDGKPINIWLKEIGNLLIERNEKIQELQSYSYINSLIDAEFQKQQANDIKHYTELLQQNNYIPGAYRLNQSHFKAYDILIKYQDKIINDQGILGIWFRNVKQVYEKQSIEEEKYPQLLSKKTKKKGKFAKKMEYKKKSNLSNFEDNGKKQYLKYFPPQSILPTIQCYKNVEKSLVKQMNMKKCQKIKNLLWKNFPHSVSLLFQNTSTNIVLLFTEIT
eukprot:403358808